MVDQVPANIKRGTLGSQTLFHGSEDGIENKSRSFRADAISRGQNAWAEYLNTRPYKLGDQVTHDKTFRVNIIPITAAEGEDFNPTKWLDLSGSDNVIDVKNIAQFPDALLGFYTHVVSSGEANDVRLVFRGRNNLTDNQLIDMTNSTVGAYDGLRRIIKKRAYFMDEYATIATGMDDRGIAINPKTKVICSTSFSTSRVTFSDGNTNQKITDIPVPTGPSGVTFDEDSNLFFVTCGTANVVSVIDGTTFAIVDTIDFTVDADVPVDVKIYRTASKFHVYVVGNATNTIKVFDGNATSPTYPLIATITLVGTGAREVALDSNRNIGYVSMSGTDTLESFDIIPNTLRADFVQFAGGAVPIALDVNQTTGKIGVGLFSSDQFAVVDPDFTISPVIISIGLRPIGVVASEKFDLFFVAIRLDNVVAVVDGADNTIIQKINVGVLAHAIALDTVSNNVVVTNESDLNISVIDVSATNKKDVLIPTNDMPLAIAINKVTKKGYASNQNGNTITVFDAVTNKFIKTITSVPSPRGIAINEKTNEIFVVDSSTNNLIRIEGVNDTITGTTSTGTGNSPFDVAVYEATGNVFLTAFGDGEVNVLDGSTFAIHPNSPLTVEAGTRDIVIDQASGQGWCTNLIAGTVSKLDVVNVTVTTLSITVGNDPQGIEYNATTDRVFTADDGDGTVTVINGTTDGIVATITVNTGPFDVAVNPDTNLIYVSNFNSNNLSIIDGSNNTVIQVILTADESADRINTAGVFINPLSDVLYVTNAGSDNISIINPDTADIDSLTFTTTATGDTERELDPTNGYNLLIPIPTENGFASSSSGAVPVINSLNTPTNKITMIGNNRTAFKFTNYLSFQLENLRVDDVTGTNTFETCVGTGIFSSFAFHVEIDIHDFGSMGTMTDTFFTINFSTLLSMQGGYTLTDVQTSFSQLSVTTLVAGVDIFTINNITGSGFNSSFSGMEAVVLDVTSSLFNITDPTPEGNNVAILGGTFGGAGAFFKAGSLTQTAPNVIVEANNGSPNSMASAQVGFTNVATPIVVTITNQDEPVIIGGTQFVSNNLERATTTTGGQITNDTLLTQKYAVTFSGLIEKVAGGTTDIGLLLVKNGSLVLTATFEIPHSVNAGIIQISATRTFELAKTDTLELAVVNFFGNADISVSQANISYSERI